MNDAKETPSICAEADLIVNGPRRDDYGDARESFSRIANMWNAQLGNKLTQRLTARDVALMMVTFKVCREGSKHKRDNLVDICGYASLANLCSDVI